MKTKNRQIIVFIMLMTIIILLNTINFNLSQSKNYLNVDIMYSSKLCQNCQLVDKYLKDNNIELKTIYYEDSPEIFKELKITDLPTLVLKDGTRISGYNNTLKYLNDGKTPKEKSNGMSLVGVLLSGLIDSINPCALASLLFVFSQISNKRNKVSILQTGLLFSGTIFIVYFLIGLSIIFFNKQFASSVLFNYSLSLLIFTISAYAIYKNIGNFIKESYHCENGICKIDEVEEKSFFQSKLLSSTNVVVIASLVAISEFGCTGQIYVPTLTLIGDNSKMLLYLILYNLVFVLPIIIATFSYMKIKSIDFKTIEKYKKVLILANIGLFSYFAYYTISIYF